ncbi:MAG: GntR family transcriptional regulator [Herbinix sp.]|nr:GntR family transcriptional regulator [Herbinix sp.]
MDYIEKNNRMPLYLQLTDILRTEINTGILKENEKLLTEMELSEKYKVSRITVRKALDILAEEELLIRKQGLGTFVRGKKLIRSTNAIMSFSQNCIVNGQRPGTKFLSADIIKAMPKDVNLLKVHNDEQVIRIRRLRYCDDIPVMIEKNIFPRKYAFLLSEDLNKPLYQTLSEHGVVIKKATKKIGICYATKEDAKELSVNEKEAMLFTQEICIDDKGEPIYYGKNIINADRYSYVLQIDTTEEGSTP